MRIAQRGEELLRWKSLALRGLAVNLKPGQPLALDVKDTALSDFFARVIVHENGRINLQDIQKGAAAESRWPRHRCRRHLRQQQHQARPRKPQRRSRPTPWRR
jgi:hypothetical protein